MLWMALVAEIAPVVSSPRPLVTSDDYPQSALNRREEGSAAIQVLINPDGRVENCTILISTHHKDLDDASCDLVKRRAQFTPATADGTRVYALSRTVITWSLDTVKSAELGPEAELQINRAPAGVHLPLQFSVSFLRTPDGSIGGCRISDHSASTPQILIDLACANAMQLPHTIIRNQKGERVSAIDQEKVEFLLNGS
jgi:TonB family protein